MTTTFDVYRCIQPSVLLKAAGGDEVAFRQLLRVFLQITPPMVEGLEQGAVMLDMAKVEAESHDLKGTARLVGAETLAMLAEALEQHARRGDGDHLMPLVIALKEAFKQVSAEIAMCSANAEGAGASTPAGGDRCAQHG